MARERLIRIGRMVAAGSMLLSSVSFDATPAFAGGGCNVPPAEGEMCPDPASYMTSRYIISWIEGRDFRVQSRTRFLGFLWETAEGAQEGLLRLVELCGETESTSSENQAFGSSTRATMVNPGPGCLISHRIGGGGG